MKRRRIYFPKAMESSANYRKSGIELLRIIAIFMVIVLHANRCGFPTVDNWDDGIHTFVRFLIESISIVAVNTFVLISGYFCIRCNYRKLFGLLFQCIFFSIGLEILSLVSGHGFNLMRAILPGYDLWFVRSYLLLFILSPLLNAFIENSSKQLHAFVLVSFYAFQTAYSCIFNLEGALQEGYSAVSFCGLYLLIQYIKKYVKTIQEYSKTYDMLVYLGCSILLSILAYVFTQYNIPGDGHMFLYSNPIVIVSSVSLFLYFAKCDFYSKVVNYIAASVFSVYLLFNGGSICARFFEGGLEQIILTHGDTLLTLALCFVMILAAFVVAVVVDQPRQIIFKKIAPLIPPGPDMGKEERHR